MGAGPAASAGTSSFGSGSSPGLQALLQRAGATSAQSDIRAQVNRETTILAEADQSFVERLMFWSNTPDPATVVDASQESRRIQEQPGAQQAADERRDADDPAQAESAARRDLLSGPAYVRRARLPTLVGSAGNSLIRRVAFRPTGRVLVPPKPPRMNGAMLHKPYDLARKAPRAMLLALLIGAAGLLAPGDARARVFDPKTFTLANGLQVVVVSDHRVPVVSHMIWYKVGAADEREGHSGTRPPTRTPDVQGHSRHRARRILAYRRAQWRSGERVHLLRLHRVPPEHRQGQARVGDGHGGGPDDQPDAHRAAGCPRETGGAGGAPDADQ